MFVFSAASSETITSKSNFLFLNQVTKQRIEEAEAVAVGKVTLSLSQCLDGGNYLYNGQQGSRDMLEAYLCDDECMMVWHLPVVPSQPLQVSGCIFDFLSYGGDEIKTIHMHPF